VVLFAPEMEYICIMETEDWGMPIFMKFNPAAFKHGVSEEDIRWAFLHPRYDGPIEDDENKYIRIGFDPHGNLLEILYNEIDGHTANIFHAMKCRSIFFPLLNQWRS
jgi:hypothetical protein